MQPKYDIKQPPMTGLLMSTNKASRPRPTTTTTATRDILNLCPTKSSHTLSGLENLPFPPLEATSPIDTSERTSEILQRDASTTGVQLRVFLLSYRYP